jgi:hypothetical protein
MLASRAIRVSSPLPLTVIAVRDDPDELALDDEEARATSCSVGVPGAAKTEVAAANAASAKVFIFRWFEI